MCRIVVISICLLAAGCVRTPDQASKFVDDLGRTVYLSEAPARVVSLAPSVTEIVFAAGAGQLVAGVTDADDFPPEVDSLPQFSALPVDFEAVLALEPDLVLASDQVNSPNDAETLEAVGIPVYFLSITSLGDVVRTIRQVGALLNTDAVADLAADSLTRSLVRLRALTADLPERPSTLFLISDVTLYAFGRGSYMHDMIALAGGESITAALESRGPVLTDEFVLSEQPQIIIGAFGLDYLPSDLLVHHPTWDIVPAVMSGRVYGLPADMYLRPGPRLVDGAWKMASVMHPGLIPAP